MAQARTDERDAAPARHTSHSPHQEVCHPMTHHTPQPSPAGPSRRKLLLAGGAGIAAGGIAAAASTHSASATTSTPACYPLAPESIEGPYYLDYDLFRRDLTEDRTGIPLDLRLTLIDAITCKPLRGAALDIWSCDATGVYSGYTSIGNDTPPPAGGGHIPPPTNSPTCAAPRSPTATAKPNSAPSSRAGTSAAPSTSTSRPTSAAY
ncbi:hypothetical protein [Streptomyces sp. NPDC059863]|uniref:hypothetical protein n=1 Tax=unclassified Streptomyces TaxID=2593676 RepID=UPI003646C6D1